MLGGVLSIFIVTGAELVSPAPFVAEQVSVTPAVSAVSVVVELQPEDDAIPDSESLTFQVTVTLLSYQPLLPSVPEMCGMIDHWRSRIPDHNLGGRLRHSFRSLHVAHEIGRNGVEAIAVTCLAR